MVFSIFFILPHTQHYRICSCKVAAVARTALQGTSIDTNNLQRAGERPASSYDYY